MNIRERWLKRIGRRLQEYRRRNDIPDGEEIPCEMWRDVRLAVFLGYTWPRFKALPFKKKLKAVFIGDYRCPTCMARMREQIQRLGWECRYGHFFTKEQVYYDRRLQIMMTGDVIR